MKVPTITFLASALSGLTLLISLVAVAHICRDVQAVWNEFDSEIATFKAITDDLWHDIVILGRVQGRRKRAIQVEPAIELPEGLDDSLESTDSGQFKDDVNPPQGVFETNPPSTAGVEAYPPGVHNAPPDSCSK
ncbi:unnamed protein product [Toxocara canis]|uniref:Col_cuticle_N domain-containing protein n=1 Tax=Toxocara canis TaxID=6265 RepID=A0A183U3G1_TOXCA|nr:unnamed protein product [Toxocara canis]